MQLSQEQQEKLTEEKSTYRVAVQKYVRSHPELSHLMMCLIDQILLQQPDNLLSFTCNFMQQPDLRVVVSRYAERRKQDLEGFSRMVCALIGSVETRFLLLT